MPPCPDRTPSQKAFISIFGILIAIKNGIIILELLDVKIVCNLFYTLASKSLFRYLLLIIWTMQPYTIRILLLIQLSNLSTKLQVRCKVNKNEGHYLTPPLPRVKEIIDTENRTRDYFSLGFVFKVCFKLVYPHLESSMVVKTGLPV